MGVLAVDGGWDAMGGGAAISNSKMVSGLRTAAAGAGGRGAGAGACGGSGRCFVGDVRGGEAREGTEEGVFRVGRRCAQGASSTTAACSDQSVLHSPTALGGQRWLLFAPP